MGARGPALAGALHIGLVVSSIDETLASLLEAGCHSIDAPAAIPDGTKAGSKFCYVVDPDGAVIELIELEGPARSTPHGNAAQQRRS